MHYSSTINGKNFTFENLRILMAKASPRRAADELAGLIASLSVTIVGERPGLSYADSLGVYLTYGNTDAERNCLSNIRPLNGMLYRAAAAKLVYLSQQALQLGIYGGLLRMICLNSYLSNYGLFNSTRNFCGCELYPQFLTV